MPSIIPTADGGRIVKTNCFECHSKCGALCYVDKNGILYKVEGNPEDPRSEGRMCPKGRSAVRILYDKHRNNFPVRRTGKRGEGKWERITWDEAMDEIVSRIEQYRREVGPESVVFGQGTGRGTNQWNQRLGIANGVNHWCCPAHICLLPIMVTQIKTIGMFSVWDGADHDDSECIVSWGANMTWSEGAFIAGEVNRSRDRAAKLIVIDPCFEHPLAPKSDIFLGVRPGSDLALAMAWINIIINEDWYDADFCKKWTTLPLLIDPETYAPIFEADLFDGGDPEKHMVWDTEKSMPKPLSESDELHTALDLGLHEMVGAGGRTVRFITAWDELRSRAEEMTPARAAKLCWLEAQDIINACKMYATAETASIAMMQGIEEHTNARFAIQAITIITAITGNLDIRGGNVWHNFWNEMLGPHLAGEPTDYHWQHKLGNPEENKFYPNSHPKGVWNAILTGEPYQVKAYISVQGNPISWCENPDRVVDALSKIDFLVVMDYYMSPTAQLADIVLPSTHWTERDYIADEFCQEWVYAQQKAVEPLYERRSDITFMRELGNRINPEAWPWKTDEDLFDFQLEPHGVTWAELKENWVMDVYAYEPKKYEKNGFDTPTKKAELYSTFFGQGSDPLPHWIEPAESPYSMPELAEDYPYVLSTGRRYPNYYHSAYRGLPELRELHPEPQILINPKTAKAREIEEQDVVWIESPSGKCKMKAHLTEGVHPRVIMAPHGWWQGCEELELPDYPNNIANINVCISDQYYDPDLGIPGMRSSLCTVYKA